MLQYTPDASARITLYQPTVSNLFNDIKFIESLGFKKIRILPNLFDDWKDTSIEIFKDQIKLYGDSIIDSFRNNKEVYTFEQYTRSFFNIALINQALKKDQYQRVHSCLGCYKCGLGLRNFATSDYLGNIYGCLHQDKLNEESMFYLGDIYKGIDPKRSENLIEICDNSNLTGYDCNNCKLEYVCDRGCVPNNYLYSGSFKSPPPMYCHYYRTLLDDAIRVMTILGEEENELFKQFFDKQIRRISNGRN
jgi:radical SAM protein with 4Fe4S-binding SPASM domain